MREQKLRINKTECRRERRRVKWIKRGNVREREIERTLEMKDREKKINILRLKE